VPGPRNVALALLIASAAGLAAASGAPQRSERPLPAFEGQTLDGRHLAVSELLGRRLLLLFVAAGQAEAAPLLEAAGAIAPERSANNFEILAVAQGGDLTGLRGLPFPVLRDPGGAIASQLRLATPAAALLVDAEGYVVQGQDLRGLSEGEGAHLVEGLLRGWLRLPEKAGLDLDLAARPAAPDFSAPGLAGGAPATLASLHGRPAVLIFFLHTCPHCHHALEALKAQLSAFPEATRPALIAISVVNRPTEVQEQLREAGLDFFPVYVDPDERIRTAYGALAGVPVIFGIDGQGRLAWRVEGWRDDRDPPLLRMRLALLAGQKPPMLLHASGYSGDEFCSVCHASEHETWLLTAHADAFETLVRHGEDRNAECVSCHVVGFGKTGGYDLARPVRELEGVGCESCHGRGGPHLSPEAVKDGDYAPLCLGCHDTKHSLGFDYATFRPRISHTANLALASLPTEEKRKRLEERRERRQALLPTRAAYVGSEACRSCHEAEHARWAESPHAKAFATLQREGKADQDGCRSCHTTGYGKGGFPEGGAPAEHAALLGVGCESCHGPGGDHAPAEAPKHGTIVSLADKCDTCVILQICGSCHDQANDPGFEFEVRKKIEAQRHSDRPLGTAPTAAGAGGR
jgi:predicted CXXCH cytochrome family protein